MTKHLEAEGIRDHIRRTSCYIGTGRHELMPTVVREVGFHGGGGDMTAPWDHLYVNVVRLPTA